MEKITQNKKQIKTMIFIVLTFLLFTLFSSISFSIPNEKIELFMYDNYTTINISLNENINYSYIDENVVVTDENEFMYGLNINRNNYSLSTEFLNYFIVKNVSIRVDYNESTHYISGINHIYNATLNNIKIIKSNLEKEINQLLTLRSISNQTIECKFLECNIIVTDFNIELIDIFKNNNTINDNNQSSYNKTVDINLKLLNNLSVNISNITYSNLSFELYINSSLNGILQNNTVLNNAYSHFEDNSIMNNSYFSNQTLSNYDNQSTNQSLKQILNLTTNQSIILDNYSIENVSNGNEFETKLINFSNEKSPNHGERFEIFLPILFSIDTNNIIELNNVNVSEVYVIINYGSATITQQLFDLSNTGYFETDFYNTFDLGRYNLTFIITDINNNNYSTETWFNISDQNYATLEELIGQQITDPVGTFEMSDTIKIKYKNHEKIKHAKYKIKKKFEQKLFSRQMKLSQTNESIPSIKVENLTDIIEEIDILLLMQNYNDNIETLWSTDGSIPIQTASFRIADKIINNVPIIKSTNNSIFWTGILWDTKDSVDDEFDSTEAEDLIFIVKYNESQTGDYGNYGYEIKVPENLNIYKAGEDKIKFFVEVE
jgi:hypothetical protein